MTLPVWVSPAGLCSDTHMLLNRTHTHTHRELNPDGYPTKIIFVLPMTFCVEMKLLLDEDKKNSLSLVQQMM